MIDITKIFPATGPGSPPGPGPGAGASPNSAFRHGEVFSVAWSLFKKHFPVFAGLAVICSLPSLALAFLADAADTEETGKAGSHAATAGRWVVDILSTCLLWAGVTLAAFDALREGPASLRRALRTAFDRLLPVTGVFVLTVLAIFGGFVMLVIPGFFLLTALYVSVPVAVLEGRGMMESLHRSRDLTRGSRGEIFTVIFILGCVTIYAPPGPGDSTVTAVFYLIFTLLQRCAFTFTALLQTVIWHRLREAREEGWNYPLRGGGSVFRKSGNRF